LVLRHQALDTDEGAKKVQAAYNKTMGDDGERRGRSIERLGKK
jgi:hypothetical protein